MANTKISALTSATTPLAGTEVLPIVQSGATVKVSVANLTAARAVSAGVTTITGPDQTTGNITTASNIDAEISSTGTSVFSGGSLAFSAASGAWKFAAIKALATNGGGNSQGRLSISVRRNATDATLTESICFHPSGGISIDSGTDPSAGNVLLGTGNLVQGTAAKGINFTANTPAAGMTSQLLNWYEEGTWTVTLYDAASGGTASVTTWTGYYTRIGRQVTATFSSTNGIDTTGMSPTGPITVSLPFTASATGAAVGSLITRNISFTGYDYVVPYVANSAARASIRKVVSGGTDVIMTVSDLTSGTARLFYFTLTYFV